MRRVTVGIPAYNEERNIVNLLRSLEGQQPLISEVIISDDSSDRTPDLVREFAKSSPLAITLLHHETRRGAAEAWNEILYKAASDVIVFYDADTIPHPSCTEQLALRISGNMALCASNSQPVQAAGVAGRASVFISNWLRSIRQSGLSQYTVMGRALAINASTAKKIQIPSDMIAIDLYLQCRILEMGLDVAYNDDAVVYFKPPSSMQDLASQVVRAVNGHNQIKDMVSRLGIGLPSHVAIAQALKNAAMDPIGAASTVIGYSLMPYYMSRLKHTDSAKWHTADSSKTIDYQQLKVRYSD
ncbi:MAG: glycosyltransferase family 2 protein [Nitrososphaera sp.]|uniref:Putative glycosyl transferase, family 2 n=1 Tax=Nitrososphaera gargensis (strain Ga9.2) TaxID=1237085 RepID=K0IE13_NITGG|nr:glycosyltransferase family 2 protein [Candidatus Nitrososphaera gargensis]AFU59606.1 putative glycosyl transferase, family 2 [Candidatus Nitrososphaera gargensis Ga9.2]